MADGVDGADAADYAAGGGGGGFVALIGDSVTVHASATVTANGGAGGVDTTDATGNGGAGGDGIAVQIQV